jgi:hypothetical protein
MGKYLPNMTVHYSVVTTFHQAGYEKYGRRMIDTFVQNWPQEVDLHVYAEDCMISEQAPNLHVHDFHRTVPALVAFKQRWGNDPRARGLVAQGPADKKGKQPGIGFRWDAIRFSHKVYAVCDHARRHARDIMFWMDADMVCHSPITLDFIQSQVPAPYGIAFLGRAKKFTECGLYALDLRQPATQSFVEQFQAAYDDGSIFEMSEWNDCWVFDRIRERVQQQFPDWHQLNWTAGFAKQGEGHPLINTPWGAYLDHLKGRRKEAGRSDSRDLVAPRSESYWSRA